MFAAYHWPAGHNEHEDEDRSKHTAHTHRKASSHDGTDTDELD